VLQKEAWTTCPEGEIPRVTVGGILREALTTLANELGVDATTIRQDIKIIAREDLRRLEIAPRLPALREEAGVSRKGRLPKNVVWCLACEFSVTPWMIRQDIATIDAASTSTRPPSPKTHPWDLWARLRPRPTTLPCWFGLRLPEDLDQWLRAQDDPADTARRVLKAYRDDTQGRHSRDDCAMTVVRNCDPDTIDRLVRTAERLNLPLVEVLTSLLLVHSKEG
jgi:hypothetical protein